MAMITYQPTNTSTNWNNPAVWSSGYVVPNDPSDVVIVPTITRVSNGQLFITTITKSGAFSIGSLQISNHNLTIDGSLSARAPSACPASAAPIRTAAASSR